MFGVVEASSELLPPVALKAGIEVVTPNAVDTELDPPETTGF